MKNYLPALFIVALINTAVFVESPDFDQTRVDYESMAKMMPYLALECVLFDREEHIFEVADLNKKKEHFEVLRQTTDQKYSIEALLRLLKHGDPKVRTLAAVALFDREDPSVLPALVELCDDDALTFDGHPELNAIWLHNTGIGPPELKQNVSQIVRKMVSFYMERAGFYYGIKDSSRPGFAEYWGARKDRSYCAGWFAIQLVRACRGTSQRYPDSTARIQKLRQRIDQLPADDRTWVLLWLNGEMGSKALVTEPELLDACKHLGPDKLILMLRNKISTDDPDLQPRPSSNWFYERMSLFVLQNSVQLLRSEDSENLLVCEKLRGVYKTPWWAIAAASLNQKCATQVLHDAMSRFQSKYDSDERAEVCAATWNLVGDTEVGYILDWFYNEKLELGSIRCRSRFIRTIGSQKNGGQMIYRLIQDPRFAEINWEALVEMARVVNKWTDKPILTEDEIRTVRHPFGVGRFDAQQTEAKKRYPQETANLLEDLRQWRERLRECASKLIEMKE